MSPQTTTATNITAVGGSTTNKNNRPTKAPSAISGPAANITTMTSAVDVLPNGTTSLGDASGLSACFAQQQRHHHPGRHHHNSSSSSSSSDGDGDGHQLLLADDGFHSDGGSVSPPPSPGASGGGGSSSASSTAGGSAGSSAASTSSSIASDHGSLESVHLAHGLLGSRTPHGGHYSGTAAPQQRLAVLSYEQCHKLSDVMSETVAIHGRGNFPTLEVRLRDLVQMVRRKLELDVADGGAGMRVRDIRLNGGCASHVLGSEPQPYNDLDLIFGVEFSSGRHYDRVKTAVLATLCDLLPEGVSRQRITPCSLKEAYVGKMVKVNNNTDGDRWSLISLGNSQGHKNVELKFVDRMRRQFEFSVDSFQVILDSLLMFYDCASPLPITENFYPTVVGESVFGDFQEALQHLERKLISTRQPEEIRGGGLLKYCNLLVRQYTPVDYERIKSLERYMCSRFFIDFPNIQTQTTKLEAYLRNHFWGVDEEPLQYQYLMHLREVVETSTVCLMGHERRQTLQLIESLALRVYYEQQQMAMHQQHQQQHLQQQQQHEATEHHAHHQATHHAHHPQQPAQQHVHQQHHVQQQQQTHHHHQHHQHHHQPHQHHHQQHHQHHMLAQHLPPPIMHSTNQLRGTQPQTGTSAPAAVAAAIDAPAPAGVVALQPVTVVPVVSAAGAGLQSATAATVAPLQTQGVHSPPAGLLYANGVYYAPFIPATYCTCTNTWLST